MWMKVVFILVFMICVAQFANAEDLPITGRWAFCAVLQSGRYYSITSAVFSSLRAKPTTHNGRLHAFQLDPSKSVVGSRSFFVTTTRQARRDEIIMIDGIASTNLIGNNQNYFYPYDEPQLDADGIAFRLNSIPMIHGAPTNMRTKNLHIWFDTDQYSEENRAGGKQTPAAWVSRVTILPVPIDTSTPPDCATVDNFHFHFKLNMSMDSYAVSWNADFTTTSMPNMWRSDAYVFVTDGTGTRTTSKDGVVSSVTSIASLIPSGTNGNNNAFFPFRSSVVDGQGLAFKFNSRNTYSSGTRGSDKLKLLADALGMAEIDVGDSGSDRFYFHFTTQVDPFNILPPPRAYPSKVLVEGDPQFQGIRGQSFQVHGIDGGIYNIISGSKLQVNARFTSLTGPRGCPILPSTHKKASGCWTHDGSYLSEIAIKTTAGDYIHVQSGSSNDGFSLVDANGANMAGGQLQSLALQDNGELFNNSIEYVSSHEVIVRVHAFEMKLENIDGFLNLSELKVRSSLSFLKDVRTHGLLGQTWNARTYKNRLVYIEGEVDDYLEASNNLFGDGFLFNRFNVPNV